MAETYCGKNCETCAHREAQNCAGCFTGPGRPVFGDCNIASCCRGMGLNACRDCAKRMECHKLADRETAPVRRQWKKVQDADKQTLVNQNAPLLGKWLWIVYCLQYVCIAGSLIQELGVWIPSVTWLGDLLHNGGRVAVGILLLQLTRVSGRYRTAGWCILLSGAATYIASWCYLFSYAMEGVLLLTAFILMWIGEYQEIHAYAESLRDSAPAQADTWKTIWKWYLGITITLYVSTVLSIFMPNLGGFILGIATLASLAIGAVKLVTLYKTAYYFRWLK